MVESATAVPKHARVFAALQSEIVEGQWRPGQRLPSEAELVDRFDVSRITIGRAMRDLQVAGLIERRRGSGTFVRDVSDRTTRAFGLLVPESRESEIFTPIGRAIVNSPRAREYGLLWSGAAEHEETSWEETAWRLCEQYIERGVTGVFFAPLEGAPGSVAINRRIGAAFDAAGIPLVLIDSTLDPYPEPSHHDLVGIDNRRAGHLVTSHLVAKGCERIGFVARHHSASTVAAREAGYREALFAAGARTESDLARLLDPDDADQVRSWLEDVRPDGVVCANDRTAARLMHTLRGLGVDIPGDVRMVGIDDLEYARLLPTPLTTLRQPTRRLGEVALAAMLERVEWPHLPVREIRLHCELVVRASCGA